MRLSGVAGTVIHMKCILMCTHIGVPPHHMDRAFSLRLTGLSLLTLLLGVTEGMASRMPDDGTICGTVVLAETEEPATGATIHLPATNRHVVAKKDGQFCIRGVAPGSHDMIVRRVGRVVEEREVQVAAGETTNIRVAMVAATLESEGITVTAEEISSSSTEGTASRTAPLLNTSRRLVWLGCWSLCRDNSPRTQAWRIRRRSCFARFRLRATPTEQTHWGRPLSLMGLPYRTRQTCRSMSRVPFGIKPRTARALRQRLVAASTCAAYPPIRFLRSKW